MPAACSHALTAFTGQVITPRAMANVTHPGLPDQVTLKPSSVSSKVGVIEGHEFRPAKRACEGHQQQQRAVTEALEAIGSGKDHSAGGLGQDGRFAARTVRRRVARTCSELVGRRAGGRNGWPRSGA
jgi:hypothetical protein